MSSKKDRERKRVLLELVTKAIIDIGAGKTEGYSQYIIDILSRGKGGAH